LLGFAFAGMGIYMPKLKQNYYAGFKLPWTLESEENWNATHRLAGKIWPVGGLLQIDQRIAAQWPGCLYCFHVPHCHYGIDTCRIFLSDVQKGQID